MRSSDKHPDGCGIEPCLGCVRFMCISRIEDIPVLVEVDHGTAISYVLVHASTLRQVVTARFNTKNSAFCLHSVYTV